MSTFLVVLFDRYKTSDSIHKVVEADKPFKALTSVLDIEDDPEAISFYKEEFTRGSEGFWCVSGEECDYLVYKIS